MLKQHRTFISPLQKIELSASALLLLQLILSAPVYANPADALKDAGAFLDDKCDDIVAQKVVEKLQNENYQNTDQQSRESANQYQSAYKKNQSIRAGGKFMGIGGSGGRSQNSTGNTTRNNRTLSNLRKEVIRSGITNAKTVDPRSVGKNCGEAVKAYNGIVTSYFSYLTGTHVSDNDRITAIHKANAERDIKFGEQGVERYSLETERIALEHQHKLVKEQMRTQRRESLLAPFNQFMQQIAMQPQPYQPMYTQPQPQYPFMSPGWLQPQPQPQYPSNKPSFSPAQIQFLQQLGLS